MWTTEELEFFSIPTVTKNFLLARVCLCSDLHDAAVNSAISASVDV